MLNSPSKREVLASTYDTIRRNTMTASTKSIIFEAIDEFGSDNSELIIAQAREEDNSVDWSWDYEEDFIEE
jgi:hypothetical protein